MSQPLTFYMAESLGCELLSWWNNGCSVHLQIFPSAHADKQTVIDINTSDKWEDLFHPSDVSQHCVGWGGFLWREETSRLTSKGFGLAGWHVSISRYGSLDSVDQGCQTLAHGPILATSVIIFGPRGQYKNHHYSSWPAGIIQHTYH